MSYWKIGALRLRNNVMVRAMAALLLAGVMLVPTMTLGQEEDPSQIIAPRTQSGGAAPPCGGPDIRDQRN